MTKEIKCFGCGAVIQSDDVKKIGYVPKNALNNEHVLCQRCFRMKNYHDLQSSPLTADDFLKTLQTIADKDCLIVYMLDLFDFNGSQITGISRHLLGKDMLVVVNKRDVLPKSVKVNKLVNWVKRELKEVGVKPLDVIITSLKNKFQMDDVFGAIEYFRNGRDVYVVGTTNVGKSTLINSIIKSYSEDENQLFITTSEFPGTTLDIIEIPLSDGSYIYDTPGIVNNRQMTHYVKEKELALLLPTSEIKQRVYQLNSKQTLYVEGLARMDFVDGEKTPFVCFFSNRVDLHRTKLENADGLYNRHQTLKLEVEGIDDISKMKTYDFHLGNKHVDIVICGLGWFSINGNKQHIKIHVPQNVSVLMRDSLI